MSNPYAPPPPGGRPTDPSGRPEGPAGRVPPRRPPTRPVDPEAARAASRRILHFGILMIAGILTSTLPLPLQVASIGFLLGAVVVGVLALRAVWVSGLRGALPLVLGAGVGFSALMAASMTALLALWPVQMERQDCLREALTISARESCEQQFQDSLDEVVERLSRRTG